jgi:IS6 family transposase
MVAVRWYLRYNLSYRDVEELLAEPGAEADHVTVYRWVQRFTPLLADAARFARRSPGDRWFVDETYVKVNGVWRYVYRAIDQYGQVIDVLVSTRRDAAAARRFFARALKVLKSVPVEVVTDAAAVYLAVLAGLIPAAWHHVERYANTDDAGDDRRERAADFTAQPCLNARPSPHHSTRSLNATAPRSPPVHGIGDSQQGTPDRRPRRGTRHRRATTRTDRSMT